MAAKKSADMIEAAAEALDATFDATQTFNPLLVALHNNDKKNLFKTNVHTAFIKTGFPLFDYFFGSVVNKHDDLGKLVGQEARVGQAAGTFNLLIGGSGSGKMEPISTKIPAPVPGGYIRMGDLKEGDKIFTHDGSLTTIGKVFDKGVQDIYKITFSDGRTALCGADHLWDVYVMSHGRYVRKTIDTKSMMKDYKYGKPESFKRRYHIPALSAPVEYPHRGVPIDPYTLGALIGNGVLGNRSLSISSGTPEVPYRIAKRNGFVVREDTKSKYRYQFWTDDGETISTKDFFIDLPEMVGKLSHEKYIPEIYIHNDVQTRMELLQGLMDTDGSISYNDGRFGVSYSSCSKQLLLDIQELIRSLGYNGNISEDKRTEKYRSSYCGSIIFQVPNEFKPQMFTLPYKLVIACSAVNYKKHRNYDMITVKEIEFSHREEARCIYVTDPSHLYVTNQFIVTHNTTLGAQIAGNIIRQFKYSMCIHFDCEQRFDVSRAETITKLPASFFDSVNGERYMIKTGSVGLDTIQEMIVKLYVQKMKLKDQLTVPSGFKDEFGRDVMMLEPTIVLIDSITTVLSETFNPDSAKEAADAEGLRANTEGARDAKTLKGFFKDIIPLLNEANIIVYGINHINSNMSMNAFIPVAKQQNFLKQDESIPGGRTMIYYPFNIVKLTAKPSDDFTVEGDGFAGHMVMVEPIKSSSNQSGNNSKGISFELVFSHKEGFDNLRSLVMYGRDHGIIEGNKARLKFKDDQNCSFQWRNIEKEAKEKPIWEDTKKYIISSLNIHLPFVDPSEHEFDMRSLDY